MHEKYLILNLQTCYSFFSYVKTNNARTVGTQFGITKNFRLIERFYYCAKVKKLIF